MIVPIFYENKGCDDIKIQSDLFKNEYEMEEVVNIVNVKQAGAYIKNGARLYDLFYSRDSLVFVFNRIETKGLYDKWCKHEL